MAEKTHDNDRSSPADRFRVRSIRFCAEAHATMEYAVEINRLLQMDWKDRPAKDYAMNTPMTHWDVRDSIDDARRTGRPILLTGANLEGLSLQGINLRGAWLQGACLTNVNLQGACLDGAYLQYADVRGANLMGADLQQANLHTANLSEANLQEANLRNAQLGDANLTHTDLRGADMRGTYLGIRGIDRADLSLARRSHGMIAAFRDRLWSLAGITRRRHLRPAMVLGGTKIVR